MILLLFLIGTVTLAREYLPLNRTPKWKTNNPNYGPDFGQPEQIHLSLGEYRVGSEYGWSAVYRFTALKPRSDGGYVIAVFGDLGNQNGRSLAKLQRMAQDGDIDLVLHHEQFNRIVSWVLANKALAILGDIAYNLDTDDGNVGDEFLRQIEPIAAYVPYMTAVGNHESASNFSHYINRFTMPNSEHNLFYSFDLGSAHFVFFSTEFYFYTEYGWKQIQNQWNWLIDDLMKANKNRATVPWILTFGHRPMYCSDFDGDDCTKYESIIRTGLPRTHAYGLEKLFYHHGIDIEIWAHEHTYERMWPVFNRTDEIQDDLWIMKHPGHSYRKEHHRYFL
ncbi:unnamed protein product [Angiostrongylus costaricensis]|uniref:Metallophos domain-containing protein n=1 Tax=Angiostrongylus costaricensis TaxID=334426 RepID=A0A158PHM7_ANGCS|nr:unnamed protein product [Angiostrongylus costaricensis]